MLPLLLVAYEKRMRWKAALYPTKKPGMTRLAFLSFEQEHVPLTEQSLSKGGMHVKMGICRFVVRLGIIFWKGPAHGCAHRVVSLCQIILFPSVGWRSFVFPQQPFWAP